MSLEQKGLNKSNETSKKEKLTLGAIGEKIDTEKKNIRKSYSLNEDTEIFKTNDDVWRFFVEPYEPIEMNHGTQEEREMISNKYHVPNSPDLVKRNYQYYYKDEPVEERAERIESVYDEKDHTQMYSRGKNAA
jgi:hypothetical protein